MNDRNQGVRQILAGAPFRFLSRLLAAATAAGLMVGALLVLALTGIVGYSVGMRYLLGQPQTWSDELVGYLMVSMVMLGAAEVMRRGEHIEVDLLTERLAPRWRRLTRIWGQAATAFVAAVLMVAGFEMVFFSASVGLLSDGYLEVPMWIPQLAVPVGAALLLLTALGGLIRLLFEPPEGGP
ncbi:MAG TPA: TRAP transporter small permease [Alphaproteobacteria bacterium]|jgi:C4-dicarboxylate transporter DctQ subunit|nr:TRAP transporter small permease [Alphaproteobacteria bacterium]MDP6270673.1 TRAP transporter small permease [Alphaproteobacteria bacterium]MDP7427461.1 TRAP transporter small permease [Alphaproteobacteria bacterium]HJM49869.1 TRAP transporter small permease [Alphaproteobacteria bacterium]|tara:strand:+ start:509 stop:1054 length:546 start_codon:yes stop_codon:yes gene_type:complete